MRLVRGTGHNCAEGLMAGGTSLKIVIAGSRVAELHQVGCQIGSKLLTSEFLNATFLAAEECSDSDCL